MLAVPLESATEEALIALLNAAVPPLIATLATFMVVVGAKVALALPDPPLPTVTSPVSEKAPSTATGRSNSATAPNGHSTAALGGAQLAINAYTESPDAAYKLIAYLTAPEQMLERAQAVGQYPTRPALYDDARLRSAIASPQ